MSVTIQLLRKWYFYSSSLWANYNNFLRSWRIIKNIFHEDFFVSWSFFFRFSALDRVLLTLDARLQPAPQGPYTDALPSPTMLLQDNSLRLSYELQLDISKFNNSAISSICSLCQGPTNKSILAGLAQPSQTSSLWQPPQLHPDLLFRWLTGNSNHQTTAPQVCIKIN